MSNKKLNDRKMNTNTENNVRIEALTIKSDSDNTILSNSLEVTFSNPADREYFLQSIQKLGIAEDSKMQLYLLEAMAFAGVRYVIE